MAISIMGGLGGLTVESDPLSLKLTGGTVSGKVNFSAVGGLAGLNVGIGGTSASAVTAGDLWITTGGSSLNFRDGTGAWRVLPTLNGNNAFTSNQTITVNNTTTALTVTQNGTGNAFEVRDETPDSEIFSINQFGKVGIGVTPDASACLTLDGNGIKFINSASVITDIFQTSATSAPMGWNPNTPDYVIGFNIGGTQFYVPAWTS